MVIIELKPSIGDRRHFGVSQYLTLTGNIDFKVGRKRAGNRRRSVSIATEVPSFALQYYIGAKVRRIIPENGVLVNGHRRENQINLAHRYGNKHTPILRRVTTKP